MLNKINNNDLLFLGKNLSRYTVGMEGNVSKKVEDGFFIKASGTKLSTFSDSDIVHFNNNGEQIDNLGKKGSMETDFHKYLLSYDGINYVAHTHPVNTLKILCTNLVNDFSNKRIFPDQVIFNGRKSCLIPYVKPGEDLFFSIKKEVSNFIEKEKFFPKLILLKNHGIISCGKNIDECIIITEMCEKSAEIFLHSHILGVNYLTKKDIDNLIKDEKEKYRQNQL